MKIVSAVILYGIFFLLRFFGTGSDKKNICSFWSYPDKVQKLLIESRRFGIPKKTSYARTFLSNSAIFTVVFVLIGLIIREESFWYYLALGEGLNLFDLLVIDLLWWQHSSGVRFEGIGDPECYLGAGKHVMAFVRAIPVFAVAALLAFVILKAVE